MKQLAFFCFSILFLLMLVDIACKPNQNADTITAMPIKDTINCDSLVLEEVYATRTMYQAEIYELQDSIKILKKANDSLMAKLFLSEHKIERVKYYMGIVDRNRSQEVFLRGWIRRAIE